MQPPKLILASTSQTRIRLLQTAGLVFEAVPSQVDEDKIKQKSVDLSASILAQVLANAKALSIVAEDAVIIGADQTLECEKRRFTKATNTAEAREHLSFLRGRTHQLYSAVTIVQNQTTIYEHISTAQMSMRNFSDDFLNNYLSATGNSILSSVGCYHYEGLGIQLFDQIKGDYSTILGLPLLPLLAFLRNAGITAT